MDFSGIPLICQPLKDYIIAEEGKPTLLECELNDPSTDVSGQWYKDSEIIVTNSNVKITNDGVKQTLEFKKVAKTDEGLYYFFINEFSVFTKCALYVKAKNNYDNVTRHFSDEFKHDAAVKLNLRNCNMEEGENFTLLAEFTSNIRECTWFKNNHIVPARQPKYFFATDDTATSKLYFNKAKKTDSGTYAVIAKTHDDKFLCSYADVLVANDFSKALFNNVNVPHVWQSPNYFAEVFEGDDVLLLFKATFDNNTIIEWAKSGREVKYTDRVLCQTYDNRYIALKLIDVACEDSGKYFLVLRNRMTQNTKISWGGLSVKQYNRPRPQCFVTRGLKPTIVSVGNGATLHCYFKLLDIKYTYVVWIVGPNIIERSNQKFKVICNRNEFILHIPVVTPEMAGEVTCQIRQHVPPRKSILLTKTTSYLAVLPPKIIEEEKIKDSYNVEDNIYVNSNLRLMARSQMSGCRVIMTTCKNVIAYFEFCKMQYQQCYFEMLDPDKGPKLDSIDVFKKTGSRRVSSNYCDWRVTWGNINPTKWYAVDVYNRRGRYTEIGASDIPTMDIKDPPEDKLYKFRIRLVKPRRNVRKHRIICFIPDEISLRLSDSSITMQRYKNFHKAYVKDTKVGQGDFASVNIALEKDGNCLTAKTAKLANAKTMSQMTKEFNILKELTHPNTVTLVDGFEQKNENKLIITMEYLWGGNLIEKTQERDTLSENDVIIYVRQILLALSYLHSKNIAHLDIKPANIVCENPNTKFIKLIDFGAARVIEGDTIIKNIYGSEAYAAPEMFLKEPISTLSDMWSVGVLTYWLLTGRTPFSTNNRREILRNVCNVLYYYDETEFPLISDRAKTFVSLLLRRNPQDRLTADAALNDEWITMGPDEGRPKKVQKRGKGYMKFIVVPTKAELQWKVLMYVLLAVVRMRALKLPYLHLGRLLSLRRYANRRLSARLQSAKDSHRVNTNPGPIRRQPERRARRLTRQNVY